ncbi:uncharacterized protein LOC106175700 [Trichonephila clavipes]|nr:uncharacterized protein LOC106175700 [Trichonephila clavipes]
MSGTINYLKTETIKVLQNLGEKNEEQTKSLIEKFEFCSNSMQNFNSKYKILKSFKANHRYIDPVEVFLGSRYEQKLSKDGIPQQIPRKDTCQYISIAETMRHIISIDGFINLFQVYKLDKSTRDFALCCIQDGFYYYSNPTFTAIDTITIELYIDDVELVNPLGSHTGIHKLGFVYFTIKDLPVSLQSSLGSIFLTNVNYSLDVEKYGYKAIFEPLIQDLKQLLDHSIEFRGNTYKIAFWQILGDNLGLNKLFGFVECFSANFCCRFCLVHKNEMQKMFKEDNSLLCHKVGHDAHVRDVIDENITTLMCGVKSDCPFNELGYWHVTNNLVVNVMHDLLEGWCATETYLILHQYIFKDKFLTLSVLNDRISNFNYGKCDSRCKPVPIKREKLSNLDGSNGQSASRMWVLMRILPLLIGNKVPYNNDFWNLYLLMLMIIDTLMAPVISLPETYALAENIADHHKLFLILFPNRHLTPKMHFALHYPRIIRQLGPPVRIRKQTLPLQKMCIIKFYQVIISMDLVEKKLKEWKLEEYLSNFENEGIDEESFFLLDETMKLLIPKAGPHLKFKKYLNSFIEASNFSSVPTSDSTVPPCNTDITYSCINDSLTIFPHPICDISLTWMHRMSRNLSVVEKEELGIGQIKKNIKEKIIKYQGTEDSSVEFLQKQQWLKENTSPPDKVLLLMQERFEGRRFEISRNATNFVSNWPRILDPHVIEAEFNMLYGEQKSDSLCLGFRMTANFIIHQAKHCGRKCAEEFANSLNFDLNSTEPSSEKICCALTLLPLLLPQRVFRRNGPKKLKIRPTSSQTCWIISFSLSQLVKELISS